LGRPLNVGAARPRDRAGAHGTPADAGDRSPGVSTALGSPAPPHPAHAWPPPAPAGRDDGAATNRRQTSARRGAGPGGREDGWRAAVCRRAGEDAPGIGSAPEEGGPLCVDRAAATTGHSYDITGLPHGAAGSIVDRPNGGAARCHPGAGVCL
jgi:hypothetical protein